jgi:predicted site-specific integrase-resolvase
MDLKLSEASARTGVSAAYLRRLIAAGRIRATRNPDPKGPFWTVTEQECDLLRDARTAKRRYASTEETPAVSDAARVA